MTLSDKTLWNEWLMTLWSQHQLCFDWIIHRHSPFLVKIYHSEMCCPAFNSLPLIYIWRVLDSFLNIELGKQDGKLHVCEGSHSNIFPQDCKQWRHQGWGKGGKCPPQILSCFPNFEWNQEKMGIFLYKLVKTDNFLRVFPPWSAQKRWFLRVLPPKNVLIPKILMLIVNCCICVGYFSIGLKVYILASAGLATGPYLLSSDIGPQICLHAP